MLKYYIDNRVFESVFSNKLIWTIESKQKDFMHNNNWMIKINIAIIKDKKYLVKQLQQLDEKVFAGAFRCLVSKTKQNYIEELMK